MNGVDELESLLDDLDLGESEERAWRGRPRPPVRTPSPRSSFQPRQAPTAASQTQVQAAARNLDAKIETLSGAVKALETRTTGIAAEQDKVAVALRKEAVERKKSTDAIRADLQQTKMLAVLLPMLTQESVNATDAQGNQVRVVTQSQNQIASLLPLFLLMGAGSSSDGKGPFGDGISPLLLLLLINRK